MYIEKNRDPRIELQDIVRFTTVEMAENLSIETKKDTQSE